jgi:hypothetical protein
MDTKTILTVIGIFSLIVSIGLLFSTIHYKQENKNIEEEEEDN